MGGRRVRPKNDIHALAAKIWAVKEAERGRQGARVVGLGSTLDFVSVSIALLQVQVKVKVKAQSKLCDLGTSRQSAEGYDAGITQPCLRHFFFVLYKIYAAFPAGGPRPHARTPGPWEDDGKVHHGPASLPSGKNQTRHLDALDAADKTAAYEGGGGGGGATIIFRVGAVGHMLAWSESPHSLSRRARVGDTSCVRPRSTPPSLNLSAQSLLEC